MKTQQQSIFDELNKLDEELKPYFNILGEPLPWEDDGLMGKEKKKPFYSDTRLDDTTNC